MQNTKFHSYIGTKVVKARPHPGANGVPGYEVLYEDGYRSWSPADVFVRCYRVITLQEKELIFVNPQDVSTSGS